MVVTLGMNTQFAVNRFPEPDDWIGIVVEKLGLNTVQLTADVLNPFLPEEVLDRETSRIRQRCAEEGVRVESMFTGAATRVNHLLHPDPVIQRVWVNWFKRLFKITAELGGDGAGSCFGIFPVRDYHDPARREQLLHRGIDAWRDLSRYARAVGLEYVMFEPMSIPRECAETIPRAKALLDQCTDGFAVPMRVCLDVDHGALESDDPRDTDPHAWIRAFAKNIACIHIKQSLDDKGGHYPFTEPYNAQGKIVPEEILNTMAEAGIERCSLFLELSFRERWPTEYSVLDDLKASVDYWRPAVEAANAGDAT